MVRNSKIIKLMIIENNKIMREGLLAMIDEQKDIEIVAAIGNGKNLLDKINKYAPDIILLDLGSGNNENLTFIRSMKKEGRNVRIIVMGLGSVQPGSKELTDAGASGFILKDITDDKFLKIIRDVAKKNENASPEEEYLHKKNRIV